MPKIKADTYLIVALVAFVIIVIILKPKRYSETDLVLKENAVLKQQNKELTDKNVLLGNKVDSVDKNIDRYAQLEKNMQNNYNQIKISINNLKPKYQKAATFSNNFNSDSIRQYFSNLQ